MQLNCNERKLSNDNKKDIFDYELDGGYNCG